MTADQYHRMLIALDQALDVFKEARESLTPEDTELKLQLTFMRAHVLRAESGHPFPSRPPTRAPVNPEITQAPWNR